ncbi:hypothetical protein GOODEAATRI_005395, partial [Goodea atripinnis]
LTESTIIELSCILLFLSLMLSFLCLSSPTRVLVNASGAPVLWRVSEEGFLHSSILNGTTIWFLQAPDGLVVPDSLLPLGQNYFLSESLQNKGPPVECSVKECQANTHNIIICTHFWCDPCWRSHSSRGHPASQLNGEGQQLCGAWQQLQ